MPTRSMRPPAPRRARGMAYALTMLLLLGVMAILLLGVTSGGPGGAGVTGGSGVMTASGNALQLTSARAQSMSALAVADAGAELTLQWLHAQPAPPTGATAFAPALWGASLAGIPARAVLDYPDPASASQQFRVLVYPDAGNATAPLKKYLIESVGVSGAATQIVRAYVGQVSFAQYAYFSDVASPQSCWASGITSFDGPVHCNNSDGTLSNVLRKTPGGPPVFLNTGSNAFTVSGPRINWRVNTPDAPGAPQTAADWQAVAAGGANSVHAGAPVIPFPTSSTLQRDTCLAGAPAPTQAGVTVPSQGGATTGGVYLHGSVQSVALHAERDLSGQSDVQDLFVQPAGLVLGVLAPVTEVQVNPATDTTTVSVYAVGVSVATVLLDLSLNVGLLPTSTQTYTGTTNGVVYCDGSIGGASLAVLDGLSGTVADNDLSLGGQVLHANDWTVATASTGSLSIGSNVLYNTRRQAGTGGQPLPESQDANFTQRAGELGVISGTINIEAQQGQGATPLLLAPVEVDAALFSFGTCQATLGNLLLPGTFTNMGSFAVGHDGTFGALSAAGALQSGFATTRLYDARLPLTPPPAFPVAGAQYDILSWQNTSTTL